MHDAKYNKILKEFTNITGITLSPESLSIKDKEYAIEQLAHICSAYREKYDKTYFLRNILYQQLSEHSISHQAVSFHIPIEYPRALFLLETKGAFNDTVLTVLKHLFSDLKDYELIPLSDTQAVLLYPYNSSKSYRLQIHEITHVIVDTLNTEALISVKIACGPPSQHLTDLPLSFEQAKTALKIGKRFHLEQNIFYYDQLGIDRLVYHLPEPVCQSFLNEVWKNKIPSVLDPELSAMINCFLKNNLNIAETARQLHMHRNTLIYRIEKIQIQTNLDIRQFEDAMTLKLALMIMNHSDYNL